MDGWTTVIPYTTPTSGTNAVCIDAGAVGEGFWAEGLCCCVVAAQASDAGSGGDAGFFGDAGAGH